MFISLEVLGSLVLDFQTNRLDLSFLNSSGVVQDDFTIVKGVSGPPPVPPAPTGLTATAGDRLVALTWNGSSGATSYNVNRSTTSGGPYGLIATIPAAISYNNTGLTSGTTYYYVVTAVNSSGRESPTSIQASATAR